MAAQVEISISSHCNNAKCGAHSPIPICAFPGIAELQLGILPIIEQGSAQGVRSGSARR
jgi:hypothetical protein